MSTQFLRIQKNLLIDLKQHLERYINTLPVFGFNSGRYDLDLIKSYLIPYLIRDKEQETSVIKKANDFISFKYGDVQFLDIMKFLGGATTLDSFLKAYKASETKGFFPYEWFDNPDKLDFPGLPPYEAFFSKFRNNNPLDKDFTDYEKLRKSGLDEQQALKKLQIKTVPPFGFNSGRYDLNLIKSYLIPYLIRDKEQETSVIKKANDFISFKYGDVQFLDIMKFLGGATTLDSFLKAYKASETKGFFPYEWFDNPDKLDFPGLPPYEAFFSKFRNNNPLDKDFTDYEKLRKSGLDEQQALKKLQIKTVPPSGLDNYTYLQQT